MTRLHDQPTGHDPQEGGWQQAQHVLPFGGPAVIARREQIAENEHAQHDAGGFARRPGSAIAINGTTRMLTPGRPVLLTPTRTAHRPTRNHPVQFSSNTPYPSRRKTAAATRIESGCTVPVWRAPCNFPLTSRLGIAITLYVFARKVAAQPGPSPCGGGYGVTARHVSPGQWVVLPSEEQSIARKGR